MKAFAWICAGLMALAVIPAYADSGCSEKHENVSRFNPTELSDYQKCVYTWAGKTSGSHAGFVWFSINGQYHHIQNNEIIDATPDGIERLIVKTILEDQVAEQLEKAQADLESLQAAKRLVDDENGKLTQRIGELNTQIAALKAEAATFAGRIAEHRNTAHVINANGNYRVIHVDYGGLTPEVGTIDVADLSLNNLSRELVEEIRVVMSEIAQKSYNEGYKDGYRDGYAAGVASVR